MHCNLEGDILTYDILTPQRLCNTILVTIVTMSLLLLFFFNEVFHKFCLSYEYYTYIHSRCKERELQQIINSLVLGDKYNLYYLFPWSHTTLYCHGECWGQVPWNLCKSLDIVINALSYYNIRDRKLQIEAKYKTRTKLLQIQNP